jgi:acyl-CoA thioester hydrolase
MAKPESWRLDPASYPYSAMTQTRFADMDVLGHINNVAMAGLFENGRVRFNRSLGERERRLPGERWLIAAVDINYLNEGHFPEDMTIASGVGRIGTSSWVIQSAAFQAGKCIATCDTTIVYTNVDGPRPIDAAFRAVLVAQSVQPVP